MPVCCKIVTHKSLVAVQNAARRVYSGRIETLYALVCGFIVIAEQNAAVRSIILFGKVNNESEETGICQPPVSTLG
jgi:hypothetical protein